MSSASISCQHPWQGAAGKLMVGATSLSSSRQQEGHRHRPGNECSRWPEGSLWAQGQYIQDGQQTSPATNHPETKGKLGPHTLGSWALEGLNAAWLLPTSWANFNPVSEPPNGDEDINITMYFQPQWRRVNKVLQPRPQWKLPSSSTVSIIITHK